MKNFIWSVLRTILQRSELDVLIFIYERTYRFGKLWESIPMHHFLEGVYSNEEKGGLYYVLPVPFKERQIKYATRRLIDMELIERRVKRGKKGKITEYRIHSLLRKKLGEERKVEWGDVRIEMEFPE